MPRRDKPEPHALKVGQRLLGLIEERRLTLEAFGVAGGIAKGHLSYISRGLSVMTIITIQRLAAVLKVPAFMLFVTPEDGPKDKLVDLVGRMSDEQCELVLLLVNEHPVVGRQARAELVRH